MNKSLIKVVGLHKSYISGQKSVEVIKGIDFEIFEGESIALLGSSGAGKSTLLCLLAGLEKPSKGKVYWQGEDISKFSDAQRADLRKKGMGFVFQFFNLLPELSALENIMLPCLIDKQPLAQAKEKAEKVLKELKLAQRASHYPYALSGGEQQRVAVCRAIINNPTILFADEPTGNLDKTTAKKIVKLMLDSMRSRKPARSDLPAKDWQAGVTSEQARLFPTKEGGQAGGGALFIATHQEELALEMDRVIRIEDGKIVNS